MRIAALHIPPMTTSWHGDLHLRKTLMPLLNNAGVDLLLSGHTHKYMYLEPCEGMDFPNLVNDNNSVALVEIADGKINITISGKTNTSITITK